MWLGFLGFLSLNSLNLEADFSCARRCGLATFACNKLLDSGKGAAAHFAALQGVALDEGCRASSKLGMATAIAAMLR